MAYDPLKPKNKQNSTPLEASANPYEGMTTQGGPKSSGFSGAPATNTIGNQEIGDGNNLSATGTINFDRLYNANAGVASREARGRQDATAKQASDAYGELTGAQGKFASGLTGAAVPNAEQQAWAQQTPAGDAGMGGGKHVIGAYYATPGGTPDAMTGKHSYVTEQQEGLGSPVLPPLKDASGNPVPGTGSPPYDPSKPQGGAATDPSTGLPSAPSALGGKDFVGAHRNAASTDTTENQIRNAAGDKYTGPNAISAMDEYGKLAEDTAAAQDRAQNPLVGLGKTDSALLGAAGRSGFEAQKQQYGHMKDDLQKANSASIGQAHDARAQRAANAQQYQDLLTQHDKNMKPGAAPTDDGGQRVIDSAQQDAKDRAKDQSFIDQGFATKDADGNVVWSTARHDTSVTPDVGGKDQAGYDPGSGGGYYGAQLGAHMTYADAASPKNTVAGIWVNQFGLSQDDADQIRSTMTESDWAAYQKAATTGPTAVRKWLRDMMAKKGS